MALRPQQAYVNSSGDRERVCAYCGRGLSQGHDAMGFSFMTDLAKKHGVPLKAPETTMWNGRCARKVQRIVQAKGGQS